MEAKHPTNKILASFHIENGDPVVNLLSDLKPYLVSGHAQLGLHRTTFTSDFNLPKENPAVNILADLKPYQLSRL